MRIITKNIKINKRKKVDIKYFILIAIFINEGYDDETI